VRADDFFVETTDENGFVGWATKLEPNVELLDALRKGPVRGRDEVSMAQGVVDLVYEELTAFGTSGGERLSNDQIAHAIRAMQAVLTRLGMPLELPFRDFARFKNYWVRNGAYGSYDARRNIVDGIFEPVIAALIRLEEKSYDDIAEPVSPREATGWPAVDEEIRELRRRFRSSTTPQDYRAVGTHCVGVVEALSRTVYDPARHLRPGEVEPPVDKSKLRLDRYVEDALPSEPNEELRGLAKRAVAVAHQVKHRTTPTRRDAGIAADAVILLANILRRLEDDAGNPIYRESHS
jgi:hypothetical protein